MISPDISDEEFFRELEEASKDFNKLNTISTKGVGKLPQKFPIPEMKPIEINKDVFDKVERYILNIFNNPNLRKND